MKALQINHSDTIAVALTALSAGDPLPGGVASESIPAGHKVALRAIAPGEKIIKYGCSIGHATKHITLGQWVHTHNMSTDLASSEGYSYSPEICPLSPSPAREFRGYLRPDGRAAVRNELWIIPLVGCVNSVAARLTEQNKHLAGGSIDGVYSFPHPFGCSQMGDDHAATRRLLASLALHPNAGGVLILGLGCENLTLQQFEEELGSYDPKRIRFLICQQSEDEYADGSRLLAELADYAGRFKRQLLPASKLVVGMKCGGSDGLSGITANPAVGVFSDLLVAQGGSTILTEVPEMFGAEKLLFNRCTNEAVFQKAVKMVEDFKQYFISHGQTVYENPSPGNKEGGISTLEDKSCGCVQKGGGAPIVDVIGYGERISLPGLNLLSGPGNDLVSATVLTAAGAHIVLFTTGRGTPFGAPVPTVKISSNTALFARKPGWIDFDAGTIATGESVSSAGARLLDYVLAVASGELTQTERNGFREIAIFKDGIML